METILCPWEASSFLFFSSNVPPLVHYSHYIAIFSALSVGWLVFTNNPTAIFSRLFALFTIFISTWALLDVVLWATNDPSIVMFSWSMQVLLEPLAFALALILFSQFIHKRTPSLGMLSAMGFLLLPLVVFLPTTLNLEGLLLSACESIEGPLAMYYTYILNLLFTLAILFIGVRHIPKIAQAGERKTAAMFMVGLVTFLLSFTSGNIISSFTDDWTISQYGLFGMPVFAALIAYSIVRFEAFKIKVAGTQVLVVTILALVLSLQFVNEPTLSKIVSGATFVFAFVAGQLLIQSVKKEIKQREELEQVTQDLARANVRLQKLDRQKSEFVSIASHQLRSPLTSIRGYASMLLEGSFGSFPDKARESIERIESSAKHMTMAVEDYLNVSRIEAGNMKYELSDFNLRDEVEHICDDVRPSALKKGLVLLFRTDLKSRGVINADIGKVVQIAHNLINNAMKYTPKGTITVFVRDDLKTKKIYVDVIDTGIGMSEETLHSIFQKFSRATDANKVNTSGTGLGLYVALKMAEDMGGTVTAHSNGEGKGSRFTLEMPLAM